MTRFSISVSNEIRSSLTSLSVNLSAAQVRVRAHVRGWDFKYFAPLLFDNEPSLIPLRTLINRRRNAPLTRPTVIVRSSSVNYYSVIGTPRIAVLRHTRRAASEPPMTERRGETMIGRAVDQFIYALPPYDRSGSAGRICGGRTRSPRYKRRRSHGGWNVIRIPTYTTRRTTLWRHRPIKCEGLARPR